MSGPPTGTPHGTPDGASSGTSSSDQLGVARTLVRCDGAHPPAALGQQAWASTERIDTGGRYPNLALRLESLVGSVLTGLSPRSADLLRIAAFAYRADQLVSRGGEADADGDRWRRHFALVVPVAEPVYWGKKEIKELLASALRFGTDDGWEFAFEQAPPHDQPVQLRLERLGEQEPPTCVVMFSGGADSLCALLEAAARGERPVPVGHWSAPVHEHRQADLLTAIRARFPTWNFPQVGLVATAAAPRRRQSAPSAPGGSSTPASGRWWPPRRGWDGCSSATTARSA